LNILTDAYLFFVNNFDVGGSISMQHVLIRTSYGVAAKTTEKKNKNHGNAKAKKFHPEIISAFVCDQAPQCFQDNEVN